MDLDKLKKNLDNRPDFCPDCASLMIFKGLGTYECEKCHMVLRDDYGKVRLYLEKNPGASLVQVALGSGVPKQKIRELLKDSRIQMADYGQRYYRCEMCNSPINSGRFCSKCEASQHQRAEAAIRKSRVEKEE